MQETGTEYNSLVFKFLDRLPFPFTLTRSYNILIAPDLEFPFNNKHILIVKNMEDTSYREILIRPQYNTMMFLVIFRIAYDTSLIKLEVDYRLIQTLFPILSLSHSIKNFKYIKKITFLLV